MKITIKRVFPRMILAVSLVTIFLAGPSPVKADPHSGWWDAAGDDPARESQFVNNPGWEGGTKTTNSRTGDVHIYEYRIDPKSGDRIEVDTDYNSKGNGGYYVGTTTTTHKDGSVHVDQNDNTGRVYGETDYYPGGRIIKSSTIRANDGTVTEETFDPKGARLSQKITAGQPPQGLVGDKQFQKLEVKPTQAGQAALPPTDNPKGQPPLQPQTNTGANNYQESTTSDPKTGFMTSKSQTQADGSVLTVNYTGNCSQFGGSDCHKTSETITDPKTNKIIAAKSCDNQGNCKDVDPKNLQASTTSGTSGGKPLVKTSGQTQLQGAGANQNVAPQAALPPTDNPKGQPPAQPQTKQPGAGTAGPNALQTTTGTSQGGWQWKKTEDPATGKIDYTASRKDPQTGVWTVDENHWDKSGQSGTATETTVNPDGSTHIDGYEWKDGKRTKVSETNRSGRGELEKTTTYNPKNGSMTSQSTTDKFGNVSITNYTGQCSQFGGPDCHKTSESTSDGKSGKVTTTSFDQNGKVTRDAGDVAAARADALARLKAGAGAKTLKANTKPQGLTGGNQNVKADVLKQIGDKQGGHLKGSKEKLETSVDKNRQKPGLALGEFSPGKKSGDKEKLGVMNTLPLTKHDAEVAAGRKDNKGQVHALPLTKHDAEMAAGQKEKAGENHILPYRQPKPRVQESAGNNKKIQTQSVQKFKARKKEWHYPAGKAPNQVVR